MRPHLESGAHIWKKHRTAKENVQRRATRLVPGLSKLSYEERLWRLRLPTLSYRQYRGDMIEVFKITHGLYDADVTAGFLQVQEDPKTWSHKYCIFKRHSWSHNTVSSKDTVTSTWGNSLLLIGSWTNGIICQTQWCNLRQYNLLNPD